jgi:hypothetical protein
VERRETETDSFGALTEEDGGLEEDLERGGAGESAFDPLGHLRWDRQAVRRLR